MGKKYYTPTIDEFYVGFECEFHGMSTGGFAIMDFKNNTIEQVSDPDIKIWDKCKVSTNPMFKRNLDSIENSIVSGQIRVKYLDQSDIESLGFELGTEDRICKYLNAQYFGCVLENKCLRIYVNFDKNKVWIQMPIVTGKP